MGEKRNGGRVEAERKRDSDMEEGLNSGTMEWREGRDRGRLWTEGRWNGGQRVEGFGMERREGKEE